MTTTQETRDLCVPDEVDYAVPSYERLDSRQRIIRRSLRFLELREASGLSDIANYDDLLRPSLIRSPELDDDKATPDDILDEIVRTAANRALDDKRTESGYALAAGQAVVQGLLNAPEALEAVRPATLPQLTEQGE